MERMTKTERANQLRKEIEVINNFTHDEAYNMLSEIGLELYNNCGLHYKLVVDEEEITLCGAYTNNTRLMNTDVIAIINCNKELETLFDSNNVLDWLDAAGKEKLEAEIRDSYFFDEDEDGDKTLEELVEEYSYDFNFEEFMRDNFESDYNEALDEYIYNERDFYADQLFETIQENIINFKNELEEIESQIAI